MQKAHQETKVRPAGLVRRLLAIVYDGFILVAVLFLAAALALLAGWEDVTAGKDPLYTAYLLVACFLYFAPMWRRGMTVGMRAWRLRIDSVDGAKPTWTQCALRFVTATASWACLGLGFAWSLFDGQKRCWHDMASRTRLNVV